LFGKLARPVNLSLAHSTAFDTGTFAQVYRPA
jgi:hypothetical protein